MSRTWLLGIDGGGSSTTAWLADATGKVLGRGSAGPSNVKAVGVPVGLEALRVAASGAIAEAGIGQEPIAVACLGLAGFDRPEDRQLLQNWNAETIRANRLVLVNDGDLVIAAGTPEGWGIGLIAGTGSIAVGRAADGRTTRAGGWGHLLGDEGSAYAVALAGLRLTARRADGRVPGLDREDRLTEPICKAVGVSEPAGLITAVYGRPMDRAAIAALAPMVVEAAERGDRSADAILHVAALDLAAMVEAVARSLGLAEDGQLPVGLAGGFLLGCPRIRRRLLDDLAGRRPGRPVEARDVPEPAAGAITLARRELERPSP